MENIFHYLLCVKNYNISLHDNYIVKNNYLYFILFVYV